VISEARMNKRIKLGGIRDDRKSFLNDRGDMWPHVCAYTGRDHSTDIAYFSPACVWNDSLKICLKKSVISFGLCIVYKVVQL